ncbi:MAG: hypothetical protein UZ21_OP11001000222 [Microgenomates bacterium OLB22]|nr:MAG: hypothetical protein UZ21_OP11001000222 [Microgenomates bacterium OLB22]
MMVQEIEKSVDRALIPALQELTTISLPENKTQRALLERYLMRATPDRPLRLFAGSCPDYAHDGAQYTHEGISDDVPFLTEVHLRCDLPLLEVLDTYDIPYLYTIMVADVEAMDSFFCERFTDGDRDKFMQLCRGSMCKTAIALDHIKASRELSGDLKSSSFFEEFGHGHFMELQHAYTQVLAQRYVQDERFNARVSADTTARRPMYRRMYPHMFKPDIPFLQRDEFLAQRTMRTMAQYLALGRCIGEYDHAVVISHPTTNKGTYNDRNKFLLPGDDPRIQQPIVPVLSMNTSIY